MHEIWFLVLAYLLGSIPFGYLIFFLTEKKDIRLLGSGNIGATNVLRNKGKLAGFLTLFLDALKGALPVIYGRQHFEAPEILALAGLAVVAGHIFPVFLAFRGGKGVGTFLGFWALFDWRIMVVFLVVFLLLAVLTRYVSLASLSAASGVFLAALVLKVEVVAMITLLMVLLIFLRHRENIKRLLDGRENRLSLKKNA